MNLKTAKKRTSAILAISILTSNFQVSTIRVEATADEGINLGADEIIQETDSETIENEMIDNEVEDKTEEVIEVLQEDEIVIDVEESIEVEIASDILENSTQEEVFEEVLPTVNLESSSLPTGFNNTVINSTDGNGNAVFNKELKQFVITGTGNVIGKDLGATDSYQFVNFEVKGDVTIVARLADFDMTNANKGQAGLVVRADNTSANADYFALYLDHSKDQYRYGYRDGEAGKTGASAISNDLNSSNKELYIKIEKSGNSFKYYVSQDPTFPSDNTVFKGQTVSMTADTWYVGMFVANGGSDTPATATFDHVKISTAEKVYYDSELIEMPVETVENVQAMSGDQHVTLTWNAVDEATHYIIKRSNEKDGIYEEIATIESSELMYTDSNVENFVTYYYKIAAKNAVGAGHDSQAIAGLPNNSNPLNLQYGKDAAQFNMVQEPNDTVFTSHITLEGSTNLDGTIKIEQNGEVLVDSASKAAGELFEQIFKLDYGRNEIKIYHTTSDGKTTLKTYNLVYLTEENIDKVVDASFQGVAGQEVNGIATYGSIQEAVNSVSSSNQERVTIFVKNGVYKEKAIIESPYISIIGEDAQKTIWTYDAAHGTINPETGIKYGTSGSASVTVKAKAIGFSAENITIENSFVEKGEANEQAVAFHNQADQSMLINVRFIGNQDTLLANTSSQESAARQYYYNCYIEGDVDFIFGRAQAIFNSCEIASYNRQSPNGVSNGYVTAASTWDRDEYGYLVINSKLIGLDDIRDESVSLGRPWRPSSATYTVTPSVIYINNYLGSHITTQGWDDMSSTSLAKDSRFYEFGNYGPGFELSDTRSLLTPEEATSIGIETVFAKGAAKTVEGLDAYTSDWNPIDENQQNNIYKLYEVKNDTEIPEQQFEWKSGNVGSNASGTVTQNTDGSVTIAASNGKIADSEDGMTFYYTELPTSENFTFTATFKVDATTVGGKTYDGQSGFGVIALDSLVTGNSSARYYNSAGAVFARYKNGTTTYNGIPGGRFVTGYEEGASVPSSNRQLINTSVFDWNFNQNQFPDPSKPHYTAGDVYTLTLRKSNTGYHAILNNDTTNEVIYYDYDNELLTVQNEDTLYVGVMASRGVQVTVSDINLTVISPDKDDAALKRPVEYITPTISSDTTKTTSKADYDLSLRSNVAGTATIKDEKGNILYQNISLESSQRILKELTLDKGTNKFSVEFVPSIDQPTFESHQQISSLEPISLNVSVDYQSFGTSENALYVSTTGSKNGEGSQENPLDIYTAVAYAQPGQEIVLLEGTYYLTEAITIDRGHDGTADEMITLMAEPGKRVVIDLSQSPKGGFTINADYWHFFGFEICNSKDNAKPLLIQGNHNIVEQLKVYKNGTTGVQISGSASEDKSMWPSYNLVQSVESYDNMDANANDADGFAAKITAGIGNIFRYCISHNNIDDGWDLYAKSTSGSIGQVVVESSIAYENGYLTTDPEKTVVGEGNGFKLGGESMPGNHILRNSISFNNYAKGVTSNSGPDVQVYNTVSFNNGGTNLSLYTSYKETNYKLDHFVSYNGGKVDDIKLTGQSSLASETNYLDGKNINGESVPSSWFENVDMKNYPTINEKGGFDFNGLETLLLESEEFLGIMATNKTEPTVITVGTEISSNGSTETPKPEEPVVPEKPNYIIPDSIKDAIDSTVIKPVTGTGVVNKPLILDITGASLSDVKSMFEKLSNFTVSVSMLKTRSNEVQYSVLLTSANESISLILTVDTNQSDVISYLNSFIKDTSKPDDSKPETPKPEENTNSTTQSSTTTNKPATGYTLMGWMTLGVFSTLLGFVSYIKRNKNDKKQVK